MSIRRGLEHIIRSNGEMLSYIKELNCHSESTGAAAYWRTDFCARGEFVNLKESNVEYTIEDVGSESSQDCTNMIQNMDELDQSKARSNAIELLSKEKEKKMFKYKVSPGDRAYLQTHLPLECDVSANTKFPVDRRWKKMWNRMIDTTNDQQMIDIENRVFENVIENIVKIKGEWEGSVDQNRYGDIKIATAIKASLKNYENSRKDYERSYFKFHMYCMEIYL